MHHFHQHFTLPGFVRAPRRRFMLGLVTANLLWMPAVYTQRQYGAFGPVADRSLGFTPSGVAFRIVPSSPRAEIAVAALAPPALHLFALTDSGSIAEKGTTALKAPLSGLTSADLNGDGEPEFFGLSADGTSLNVLSRAERAYVERNYALSVKAHRAVTADINNDGIPDILLFGKSTTGVTTLLGKPGGTLEPGPELFPEISVSDLRVLDMNGDGINDVILCNWLSNQLTVVYGISRLVFSEQLSVSLPGEPDALACTWLARKRWLGVAVTLPAENKVLLLRGAPDGEFRIENQMALPGRPSGVGFSLLNGDQFPDLVVPTDAGTSVALGEKQFGFLPPVTFGPGASCAGWGIADFDGDRRPDFAAAERTTERLVILGNAQHGGRQIWEPTYAVGAKPHGLAIDDVNGDGLPDIAVANNGSSTITLLLNRGKGMFTPGQWFSIADQPVHLSASERSALGEHALVTAHPASEQIGVAHWENNPENAVTYTISSGARPHIMRAWHDSTSLRILVRYPPRGDASTTLSLFEQISGRQFLERSLRANLPERLGAVTVDRGIADPYRVAFVSTERGVRASSLFEAAADQAFALGPARQIMSIPDSLSGLRGLLSASLTVPGRKDYILVFGKPLFSLGLALRNGDGTFPDSLVWVRNVKIEEDDDIIVRDVDGDGRPDITVRNDAREQVVTYYGGADGFDPGLTICSAAGIRAIAVAPLLDPTMQDLVLSRQSEGTVSIMFNPFHR